MDLTKTGESVVLRDVINDRRLSLLVMQLKIVHNPILNYDKKIYESLSRICLFIYQNTNIHLIDLINEDILYEYIRYHRSKDFKEVDFITAIKDVKHFLQYLEKNILINLKWTCQFKIMNFGVSSNL